MRQLFHNLRKDEKGAYIVELALCMPVFLMVIMGGSEIGHTMYVQSVLQGELQKAARDKSLEDAASLGRQGTIEMLVRNQVKRTMPTATVTFNTRSFVNYKNAQNLREEFTDLNLNGICDAPEPYVDANNSGTWDLDSSKAGRGGAKDVVVMTATVTYPRLPFGRMISGDPTMRASATTLLRNQPSDLQAVPPVRVCA